MAGNELVGYLCRSISTLPTRERKFDPGRPLILGTQEAGFCVTDSAGFGTRLLKLNRILTTWTVRLSSAEKPRDEVWFKKCVRIQ